MKNLLNILTLALFHKATLKKSKTLYGSSFNDKISESERIRIIKMFKEKKFENNTSFKRLPEIYYGEGLGPHTESMFERNKRLAKEAGLPYDEWWELNKHKNVYDYLYPGKRERREKVRFRLLLIAVIGNVTTLILLSLKLLQRLL